MKKIILFITLILFLTGCTNINKTPVEDLINQVAESKLKLHNTYRTGYKYYLPNSMQIRKVEDFNEILTNKNYTYYLYVDIVSYYNNVEKDYEIKSDSYLSQEIIYKDSKGYLEVNSQNDKYLIEIMYNYAKIELIVDIGYLKEAITNAMIILSTINYNDDIINNMMGEDILNFNEEQLNIFDVHDRESNFIEYVQRYDTYEDEMPDPDLIN